MAKFKVGDRVRLTEVNHVSDWGDKGDTGVIVEVCERDEDAMVRFESGAQSGITWHVPISSMEHIHPFTIGDRVEPTIENVNTIHGHWRNWRGTPVPDAFYVSNQHADLVRVSDKPGGGGTCWPASCFQKVEQWDAPGSVLKIEAGKFYRTRDGRKVKCIAANDGDDCPHAHDGGREYGEHWLRREGTSCIGDADSDLVAEWRAEPANDNAEPDATLAAKITADTSELDAEINRVAKRLKKLAKKARKLGIDLRFGDLRDAA